MLIMLSTQIIFYQLYYVNHSILWELVLPQPRVTQCNPRVVLLSVIKTTPPPPPHRNGLIFCCFRATTGLNQLRVTKHNTIPGRFNLFTLKQQQQQIQLSQSTNNGCGTAPGYLVYYINCQY